MSDQDDQQNQPAVAEPVEVVGGGGVMTVNQALKKAGGLGRYQWFLLITLTISMNGPGLLVYGIAYY